MKRLLPLLVALTMLFITACKDKAHAEKATTSASGPAPKAMKTEFIVGGSCGMCTDRIVEAVKKYDGVSNVSYNLDKQLLSFDYTNKVNVKDIKVKLADLGHDTDETKSTDEKYNSLPGCCRYRQ